MSAKRPERSEAESAVRTLLRWAGEDPDREGLRDTPARVARAYQDWFSGYADDPDRKSTRLNSSHVRQSRMPSSA